MKKIYFLRPPRQCYVATACETSMKQSKKSQACPGISETQNCPNTKTPNSNKSSENPHFPKTEVSEHCPKVSESTHKISERGETSHRSQNKQDAEPCFEFLTSSTSHSSGVGKPQEFPSYQGQGCAQEYSRSQGQGCAQEYSSYQGQGCAQEYSSYQGQEFAQEYSRSQGHGIATDEYRTNKAMDKITAKRERPIFHEVRFISCKTNL